METEGLTITEFLLRRIAEDEAVAKGAEAWDRPHWAGCELLWMAEHCGPECTCDYSSRVLAECEAKRRIVDLYRSSSAGPDEVYFTGWATAMVSIMQRLAAVYADHPDYREEWRA